MPDSELLLSDIDYIIVLYRMLLDYIIDGMTLSYRKDVRARLRYEFKVSLRSIPSWDFSQKVVMTQNARHKRFSRTTFCCVVCGFLPAQYYRVQHTANKNGMYPEMCYLL